MYNKEDNKYSSVPIGKPAENVQLYVLDDNLNLMPFEQPGQLYISGKCLSKGYVKLEEANSKKFISSPFDKHDKLYKTGDIVVLHKNLLMEYIGRNDFQVKINGFRIEIGEIQSKILKYPNIKDCYVTTIQKNNTKALCAYYVCNKEKTINLKQIKKLGPLENILKMLPGARKMGLNNVSINPKDFAHVEAIILSMTPYERKHPEVLKASRKTRISKGSGRSVEEINRLLKQFEQMKNMMKQISQGNMKLPF